MEGEAGSQPASDGIFLRRMLQHQDDDQRLAFRQVRHLPGKVSYETTHPLHCPPVIGKANVFIR